MVNIAAVNVGNYRGIGARYVNSLFAGCTRNLTVPFRFICFTDEQKGLAANIEPKSVPTGLVGWYNKIALFRSDAFPRGERVVYLDLDSVVVGNIDFLARYDGKFATLESPWGYGGINSSVMAWKAGDYDFVWDRWASAGFPPTEGGDQSWIVERVPDAVRLQHLFPGRLLSFKLECGKDRTIPRTSWQTRWRVFKRKYISAALPASASVVYFHGQPKPDNCRIRWVRKAWRSAT